MTLHEHPDQRLHLVAPRFLLRLVILMVCASLLPAPGSAEASARFSDAEIESLLAPIALYPDTLLTQILVASTYPLDVVEAARFVSAHPELENADAVLAAAEFDWDPSVQALTAFPDLLRRMDQDLRWTRALGEAFLGQQEAVMVSLQTLRQRAQRAGTLEGSEYLQVERQGQRLVLAAPRQDRVYVPWYDSTSAYGEWSSPSHQPVYWAPEPKHGDYRDRRPSRSSLYFGPAIHLDPRYYPTRLDWHRRGVVHRHRGEPWKHGGRDHRDRRLRVGDHRQVEDPRTWPEAPTASLSQQRVGAIDTRDASARLRALQLEAAAAAARERSERLRNSPPQRAFGGSQQEASSQRSAARSLPSSSPQALRAQGQKRSERPPETSRPSSLNNTRSTPRVRSFGGSGPHSQRSAPAPRPFGGAVSQGNPR